MPAAPTFSLRMGVCLLLVASVLACFFITHSIVVEIAQDHFGRDLRGGAALGITIKASGILFYFVTSTVIPVSVLMQNRRFTIMLLVLFLTVWSALLLPAFDTHPLRSALVYLLGLVCIGGGLGLAKPLLRFTARHFSRRSAYRSTRH